MARRPEIGNIQLYPDRPLRKSDRNGYVLKFYCPIQCKRIRRNCGTRDKREARKILRECRERLLNGKYVESNGAITESQAPVVRQLALPTTQSVDSPSWQTCYDRYLEHQVPRVRHVSIQDTRIRLSIAERILQTFRTNSGFAEGLPIEEVMTTEMLEYLQLRLLAGDAGRYDYRAPSSVNSVMTSVMAFARYCVTHGLLSSTPYLEKLPVDEVMKGRPLSREEFERMIEATPQVVGKAATAWTLVLSVIWESGLRISDVMDLHWSNVNCIHPIWGDRGRQDILVLPSSQKNGRVQQIPMLKGLKDLLLSIPAEQRNDWIVNPAPTDSQRRKSDNWFRPTDLDLAELVRQHSNSEIARKCGVSETAVRKWMSSAGILREHGSRSNLKISDDDLSTYRQRADNEPVTINRRMTVERVGRVISKIGRKAEIVVREADKRTGQKRKYASSHDIRRGFAVRLINAGVSAETLKLVMRHQSFATTERYYGAVRSAQVAGIEISECLARSESSPLVGGLMGGPTNDHSLSADEVKSLKALLARL